MRKTITLLTILLLVFFMVGCENAINPTQPQTQNDNEGISLAKGKPVKYECNTIQSGEIVASTGEMLTTGYDVYGYNYQAHLFNGYYGNSSRPAVPVDGGTKLVMKWNDTWLSNKDCGGMYLDDPLGPSTGPKHWEWVPDGLLDRHAGLDSYIGSGAWLTNHQSGEYNYNVWSVNGDWVIVVNGSYDHEFTFTGNSGGTGGYPSSGPPYQYDEVLEYLTVSGTHVEFKSLYYVSGVPTGYYWIAEGEINPLDGSMSGTWSNASQSGDWHSETGTATVLETCKWNYFIKMVAVPDDAIMIEDDGINGWGEVCDMWYTADGTEIGPDIWGAFAIIQQVYNDPCDGYNGLLYKSPVRAGFGGW